MTEEMTLENIQCLMEDISYYDSIHVSDEEKTIMYRNYGGVFGRKVGSRISIVSRAVILMELLVAIDKGKLITKVKGGERQ